MPPTIAAKPPAIDVLRDPGLEGVAPPVHALVAAALAAMRVAERFGDVRVRIAPDAVVQRLNREFRGKDRPTDVLSFPMEEPGDLGDLVLGHPFVLQEAARLAKNPIAHAQHLVIHGVLHLAGWDHERDEDEAEAMRALERRAMAMLGLGDPYA